MKILIIGGTGNISWNCVRELLDRGNSVTVLNRHQTISTRRMIDSRAKLIIADVNEVNCIKEYISDKLYDIIIDFICLKQLSIIIRI